MENNDKQTKETKAPSFEINSRRERVNFTGNRLWKFQRSGIREE